MTRYQASLARQITTVALLTAMALALQWLESLLPTMIPGIPVRIGLANIFVLYALLTMTVWDAFAVAVLRNILFGLITGNVSGVLYSLCGSILSWTVMTAMLPAWRKKWVSPAGISAAGAFAFQLGQAVAGRITVGTAIWYYFPYMGLLSVPAGIVTGVLCNVLKNRLPHVSNYKES